MKALARELLVSLVMTVALAVIVCGVYPVVVFAVAQGLFPARANGSIVYHNGAVVGSMLLGQNFRGAQYFHPRPSAAGAGYDGMASGGSNLGPTSKDMVEKVRERVEAYRAENGLRGDVLVPADAVTASGSGLDPHITVENAILQAARVAKTRGLSVEMVREKIRLHSSGRTLGIFGMPRVNVLELNLALDTDGKDER